MKRPITDCVLFTAAIIGTAAFYDVRGSDVDWSGWVVVTVLAVIIRLGMHLFWLRRDGQVDPSS